MANEMKSPRFAWLRLGAAWCALSLSACGDGVSTSDQPAPGGGPQVLVAATATPRDSSLPPISPTAPDVVPTLESSHLRLSTSSATGAVGTVVRIPVTLQSTELTIAGTQNDIVFDPTILDLVSCRVNPVISDASEVCQSDPVSAPCKAIAYRVVDCTDIACSPANAGKREVRTIVIALQNVVPIPDGLLYTCDFAIARDARAGSTPLEVVNAIASTPRGERVTPDTADGFVIVLPSTP